MGLCRCPRRKVTTQFCYEHRVNVCEFCMVDDHPNCIVQGYLQWLKDSDYEPVCTLCRKELMQDECVRLLCYHVFHWRCLDERMAQLPLTTAPAGYCCPSCNHEVIPRENVASPVAEVLRKKLQRAHWASSTAVPPDVSTNLVDGSVRQSEGWSVHASQSTQFLDNAIERASNGMSSRSAHTKHGQDMFVGGDSFVSSNSPTSRLISVDEDDKYKRKSVFELMHRWFQARVLLGSRRRDPTKRLAAMTIGILVIFLLVVYLFSQLGRSSANGDYSLDPENNPELKNIA